MCAAWKRKKKIKTKERKKEQPNCQTTTTCSAYCCRYNKLIHTYVTTTTTTTATVANVITTTKAAKTKSRKLKQKQKKQWQQENNINNISARFSVPVFVFVCESERVRVCGQRPSQCCHIRVSWELAHAMTKRATESVDSERRQATESVWERARERLMHCMSV